MLVEHVRRLAARGEPLIHSYYDGIGRVAHEYRLREEFFAAALVSVDALVGRLLHVLPESAALLVTSDHGKCMSSTGQHLSLDPLASLCEAFAGEGALPFAVRTARPAPRISWSPQAFGNRAWVSTRDRLIDEGRLGAGHPSHEVRQRIGNVVLAARTRCVPRPDETAERRLLGHHGSMADLEMLVPLLAGPGTAQSTEQIRGPDAWGHSPLPVTGARSHSR